MLARTQEFARTNSIPPRSASHAEPLELNGDDWQLKIAKGEARSLETSANVGCGSKFRLGWTGSRDSESGAAKGKPSTNPTDPHSHLVAASLNAGAKASAAAHWIAAHEVAAAAAAQRAIPWAAACGVADPL